LPGGRALLESGKAYRKLMGYQMLPLLQRLLDEPPAGEALRQWMR